MAQSRQIVLMLSDADADNFHPRAGGSLCVKKRDNIDTVGLC